MTPKYLLRLKNTSFDFLEFGSRKPTLDDLIQERSLELEKAPLTKKNSLPYQCMIPIGSSVPMAANVTFFSK